jgi:hypothetical protein
MFLLLLRFLGDEPTGIARSGHGAPTGRGRGTLSEDTASTPVTLLCSSVRFDVLVLACVDVDLEEVFGNGTTLHRG